MSSHMTSMLQTHKYHKYHKYQRAYHTQQPVSASVCLHKPPSNIVGSGGIIYDPVQNAILVVKGKLKWSLPKGHCEPGESWNETAMREISEETSLELSIDRDHYWKKVNKYIYYYIMINNADQVTPKGADPYEIEEARWLTKSELERIYDQCNKQLQYFIDKWGPMINVFVVKGSQLVKSAKQIQI